MSWLVVVRPDDEAQKLGLKEFTTTIMIDHGVLWDSTFHTRGGCIAGGYPPAKATWYDTGSTESFTAKYEAKEEAGVSSFSWKGVLSEHRITGEVTLGIAGPRRSAEEIDKLLEPARQSLLREPRAFNARGDLINGPVLEALQRDVERARLTFTAPGRTLHFTFETMQTNIGPTGNWVRAAVTSRPSR